MSTETLIITISSTLLGALVTGLLAYLRDIKQNSIRKAEREHDMLLLEPKDCQIRLYQVEKELDEWKQKYYTTIQELIEVKADLEHSLLNFSHPEIKD